MSVLITQKTYEELCAHWARIIILLSESEIQIWPPLSGSYSFIRQFLMDRKMQKKVFGKLHYHLAFMDGHEIEDISFEELEKQFINFLHLSKTTSMETYIEQSKEIVGLYIVGMDTALRSGHAETLKRVGTTLERFSHCSLVFFTEMNIPESDLYQELISKNILVNNIKYQALFSPEDAIQVLNNLQKQWHFSFKNNLEILLAENIGGHPLLLEEAARFVREHPQAHFKEVLAAPSLIRKAFAIFKMLSPKDRQTIRDILFSSKTISYEPSEYLNKTGLVNGKRVGLQYWYYLKHNLLTDQYTFEEKESSTDFHFSYTENRVFELLSQNTGNVVNRDEIAQAIWDDDAHERYSDWAIDQLIHRIREKFEKTAAPYEIQTKKGEGFMLIAK